MSKALHEDVRKKYILFGVVLFIAIVLRFIRYNERWALAYDQARDAIIAQEVLHGKPMPATGPFSSAGEFTTGPVWYWFVVAATAIYPRAVMTPWVVLTALFVLSVFLLMETGFIIGGTPLSILLGLFAAVSPAQIEQGFNLTNPSLVSVFSFIILWAGITYLKSDNLATLIILGVSIGCAVTTHYQAAMLLFFVCIIFILRRPRLIHLIIFAIGAAIPFIPLIRFDITHGYFNYRGIIDYLRFGQYRVYIPNRWLTHLGVFLPHLWSIVVGGRSVAAYILMTTVAVSIGIAGYLRLFTPYSASVLLGLIFMIAGLRYYRGERFDGYFVFLHPFILTVSAWAVWVIYTKQKIAGIILAGVVIIGGLCIVIPSIFNSKNWTLWRVKQGIAALTSKYPKETFNLFEYNAQGTTNSVAVVLCLSHAGKISSSGHKIGFGHAPRPQQNSLYSLIPNNTSGFDFWDIDTIPENVFKNDKWENINPESIYRYVAQWYRK
jgi:hypothetical protein